ncbi:tRNA methyltransferase ppm2 [Drechslerella dactyloides]|uniref:tRNA wybutosine-synthesizing protein 4 n=1 Tax=Drechslerella dactyloides TaxID=74499 RepID=A0AAD6IV70_DREDA|nr:tRNA methyltransferase ppm2 [Drechslerella dactyloides]
MSPAAAAAADAANNAAIVATNDSSIVSKRSVEKLYVADRTDHLLRYFVPKFQRRSPLINRGYWLRMRLIRKAVEDFINIDGDSPKYLAGLLASDPLPFYYAKDFPHINFVDIDFPESINRKCEIIRNTPELVGRLNGPSEPPSTRSIVFAAGNYVAAGIDLSNLEMLNELFGSMCQETDQFLFISEVAITYMPVKDADALIKWASKFPNARFSLIEQILPAGPKHPFASTMLSHFRKINSPLRNIGDYPTLSSQVQRFYNSGWKSVNACDLYGAWCNLVPDDEKSSVDSVEAFDEYEDFVLFGQHYLYFTTDQVEGDCNGPNSGSLEYETTQAHTVSQDSYVLNVGRRKFGAASQLDAMNTLYHGGMDGKTRSSSIHVFDHTLGKTTEPDLINRPPPRSCHTLTTLEDKKILMVGGRGGPDAAYSDYDEDCVLVFGGKGSSKTTYDSWLIWSEAAGWRGVPTASTTIPPSRFSASMAWFPSSPSGILSGGFHQDGTTFSDIWTWTFEGTELDFVQWDLPSAYDYLLSRGGSQMVSINDSQAILCGGISGKCCFASDYSRSFLLIDDLASDIQALSIEFPIGDEEVKRPILAGFSCVWSKSQLEVIGGGIIAFSPGYLKSALGNSREVVVHKIDDAHMPPAGQPYPIHMNFNSKNFVYTRLPFSDFIDIAFSDKQDTPPCYLRSISNKPIKHASLLERDFPEISSDFSIPSELSFIAPSLHSSILRISSAGVGVWLHYDVCANVLFHVKGRKRILLFPPTDIPKLQFPPGKTTSLIDNIFDNIPSGTHPMEVVMHPGEALYLPPFWLHAVLPLEPCIAVNIFFHSFDAGLFSEGRDLYGNKDLACYQEGRDALKGVLAKFEGLDDSVRRFYMARLGQELLERALE